MSNAVASPWSGLRPGGGSRFSLAQRALDLFGVPDADLRHHLAEGPARLLGRHATLLELDADGAHRWSLAADGLPSVVGSHGRDRRAAADAGRRRTVERHPDRMSKKGNDGSASHAWS